jgi:hypothetical protein
MKKKKKINTGYYHEAIDRIHLINCMIQDFLLEHQACENHPKISKKVKEASVLLGRAYQDFAKHS